MEKSLYADGLRVFSEDLTNTEDTRIAAIIKRTTDWFSDGVLSGWSVSTNQSNPQLVDVGRNTGVENRAYSDGERITASVPAVTGIALVDNSGGPNYILLSYFPQPASPRAHAITGVSLNTRQTDSFRIEVKTSISTTNLDTFGRKQILLGQVINNYGQLIIIPQTGVVQLNSVLQTLSGRVVWVDNPLFRFDKAGPGTAPLLTLRWLQSARFVVDQTTYQLQGTASTQFAQGLAFFLIAALDKTVSPPKATLSLASTTTNLTLLPSQNQALIGFITTDGGLFTADGMIPASAQDDSGTYDIVTIGPSTVQSRLNQILIQLRTFFGTASWFNPISTISGTIRGAINLSTKTITLPSTILDVFSKFTAASPVTDDNANYQGATGHGHTGADGDGPRLTLDALETAVQRVLDLSSAPVTIQKGSGASIIVDDRDYRKHLIGMVVSRIEAEVNWLNPTQTATRLLLSPSLSTTLVQTGNGAVLAAVAIQVQNPVGGVNPSTGVQWITRVLTQIGTATNAGKLQFDITLTDEQGTGGQYIQSISIKKIGVIMFPVINANASPLANRIGLTAAATTGAVIPDAGGTSVPGGSSSIPGPSEDSLNTDTELSNQYTLTKQTISQLPVA